MVQKTRKKSKTIKTKSRSNKPKSMFIYPPYKHHKDKIIERYYNANTDTFKGTEINRKDKYWGDLYRQIDEKYNTNTKILNKDTYLYRCSIQKDPLNFITKSKSPLIYFGLDFVISVWIALEIEERSETNNDYYMHIYKLKDDTNYTYLQEEVGTPIEIDKTSALNNICIHPQLILHGNTNLIKQQELGIELTIPIKKYNIEDIVNHVESYKINTDILKTHKDDYIYQWDPKKSLEQLNI